MKLFYRFFLNGAICILIIFSSNLLNAQSQVRGTVADSESQTPIPGVNVTIRGTTTGTTTDAAGQYQLSVTSPDDVLLFSFIGYLTRQEAIDNRNVIDVNLDPDIKHLEEIVVVGYGTQKKSSVTGAVSSIKGEAINNLASANITQALQGRTAGVRVEVNGGSPGASANVIIRGTGSLTNVDPLYVIDGVFSQSMSFLNPADIESMEVLKDASAAAIYGARAGQGVVIITTKRGSMNQPMRIDISTSYGWQKVVRQIDYMNAREYADYRNQANDNDDVPRAPANDSQFDPSIDSDIQNLSLRTAPIQNHGIRLYGGGQNSTYSISANYLKQEGIVVSSGFERSTFRVNTSQVLKKLKIDESLILTRSNNNQNTDFGKEFGHIPTAGIFDNAKDGGYTAGNTTFHGISRSTNWYGIATLKDDFNLRDEILGNITAEYEIVKGLKYSLRLSMDYINGRNYLFTPTYNISNSDVGQNLKARLSDSRFTNVSTIVENILTYKKSFGKHDLDLLGAYSRQKDNNESLHIEVQDFPNNNLRVVSAANDIRNRSGFSYPRRISSTFGRFNYSYAGKYLVSASIRRDGSSNFGPEHRYGVFPSASVGWNIAEEDFFRVQSINGLKIRASYGVLGSDNLQPFLFRPVLNINSDYSFGTNQERLPGVSQVAFANPEVRWEKTKTTDIGVDLELFEGSINVTVDYFKKRSEDILVYLDINPTSGTNRSVIRNAATIDNKGFEFQAAYNRSTGGIKYSVGGNFTILDNKVVDLGKGVNPIRSGFYTDETFAATRTEAGHPVASFFGFIVDGIYQTQEEIDAEGLQGRSIKPGDLKFRDTDGDGTLTLKDQTFIGSPNPDFEYGINFDASYGGFDITLFFQGVSGNKIWNGRNFEGVFAQNGNKFKAAKDYWTPENPDAKYPRPTSFDPGVNRRESSFYLEDGSYFRLRNLSIGYSIPQFFIDRLGLTKVRLFMNVENVFIVDKYSGYYPEIGRNLKRGNSLFNRGVDENIYPMPRTIALGLQLNF